jgi:hypothetical protein
VILMFYQKGVMSYMLQSDSTLNFW